MKREPPTGRVGRSEDKKARLEAGLDLELCPDLTDTQLEHVVKEVSAPKSIQDQLDSWVASMVSHLKDCSLPKVPPSSLEHLPSPLPDSAKYPGATVRGVKSVGSLASKTLVFPQAIGCLAVSVGLVKVPSTPTKLFNTMSCSLAQIYSALSASDLVMQDCIKFCWGLFSPWPHLLVRPAGKLGKQLTVEVRLVPDIPEHGAVQGVQDEVQTLLAGRVSYRTCSTILSVWARQCQLVLPPVLLDTVLLHCHNTEVVTTNLKPWQCVKKVWSFLSTCPLPGQQLILGVTTPVPTSEEQSCPLLARDGTSALFPGLSRGQWGLVVMLASQAVFQTVEQALLRSVRTEALFDRVFSVVGESEVSPLVRDVVRGLEKRCEVVAMVGGQREWRMGEQRELTVEVGVRFDPAAYWQPATQGPEATSAEATAFREFWGDRSELRRFQDGVVKEVVVWGEQRDGVVGDVVRAVVSRHHKGCQVTEGGAWGERLLSGNGGLASRGALDKLVPLLYGLEGLPLAIASVSPYGAAARGSQVVENQLRRIGGKTVREKDGVAVLTGKGGMVPTSVEPLDVMLVAEHSGKWPKEEGAMRRVRLAWLMEVGRALGTKLPGCVVRLAGERLIVMQDQTVFRFSVGERGEGVGLLCELSSWLSGVSKTLPAWSGCVRLCLRWVSAHLLSSISSTAVEVSCAAVLTSSPHTPTSPTAAFLLWLHTMATHDWNDSPLTSPGCGTSMARSALPPMAVLTPHSPSPSYWTRNVSWPELQRLVSLASHSMANISSPRAMFTPSLACYEALIHLKPLMVSNRHMSVSAMFDKTKTECSDTSVNPSVLPIVDFNPVALYVAELQQSYGSLANFYYDKYGGNVVAVKILAESNKVKVSDLSAKMMCIGGTKMVNNWSAITEDWKILGEGLVKDVEVTNSDLLL